LVGSSRTRKFGGSNSILAITSRAFSPPDMLFVSHDRHFLAALSNRVLELTPDGVHQYGGGYPEARRLYLGEDFRL
jgi:hypothetical protein